MVVEILPRDVLKSFQIFPSIQISDWFLDLLKDSQQNIQQLYLALNEHMQYFPHKLKFWAGSLQALDLEVFYKFFPYIVSLLLG